jgi:CubicO group peptidase (beta-lactamase class C family)
MIVQEKQRIPSDRRQFLAAATGIAGLGSLAIGPSLCTATPFRTSSEPVEDASGQDEGGIIYHRFANDVMKGFPPSRDKRVSLLNHQQSTANQRYFSLNSHSAQQSSWIEQGKRTCRPLPRENIDLSNMTIHWGDNLCSVVDWLKASDTDAFVALHQGKIVAEHYFGEMRPRDKHILWSTSKGILGSLVWLFLKIGTVDPNALITRYVPELVDTAFEGATVRQALDMQTGIQFRWDMPTDGVGKWKTDEWEFGTPEFEQATHEKARWARANGGSPQLWNERGTGQYDCLLTLKTLERPHGQLFNYCEPNSIAMQLVIERATQTPMLELLDQYLWSKLGAEQGVTMWIDPIGSAVSNIGLAVCARDLARWGQLLLDDGRVDGHQVFPAGLLEDVVTSGEPEKYHEQSNLWGLFPANTAFRNYLITTPPDALGQKHAYCVGMNLQWVYMDRTRQNVIVKLSSNVNDPYVTYPNDLVAMQQFSERLSSLI